jgi:hypothetical protein
LGVSKICISIIGFLPQVPTISKGHSLFQGVNLGVTLGGLAAGRHGRATGQLDGDGVKGLLEQLVDLADDVVNEPVVLHQVGGGNFVAPECACCAADGKEKSKKLAGAPQGDEKSGEKD